MKIFLITLTLLLSVAVAYSQGWIGILSTPGSGGPNTVGAGKAGPQGPPSTCATANGKLDFGNTCDTVYITGIFQ